MLDDHLHGRIDPPFHADERTMLVSYLDWQRGTVLWKSRGLTQAQMATTVAASTMTVAGIVKHLALVEDSWFTKRFAGQGEGPWAGVDWKADPDWEFHSAVDDSPEDLLALYEASCARSRVITDGATSLDERSAADAPWNGEHWTLRWILVHMIEETARHAGHLDLLREAIDGDTGE